MTRKEKIYNELKRLCSKISLKDFKNEIPGFDATEVGERINIDRSNSSKELNQLVNEKRAIKILGRPVLFFDSYKLEEILGIKLKDDQFHVDSLEDIISINDKNAKEKLPKYNIFNRFIGSGGSLEVAIKQAKAAILYPPRGLHTLLVGPTGVGKTTFAEMMYNYAVETGQIDRNAKLTIFNCSEYAENPQLILSQLFGHVKGAFTGADNEKEGLIERTNGGILLLDEIHRLAPEGQEMLFLLMDKNIYRRLGETETTRHANILLIGATTEDVNSTLLKTFLRRIPMIIRLPSLSERALIERYQLIKQFFKDQSKSIQAPIMVYKDVIKALLLYNCQGNIGQLKGDIQLVCARGFLDYKTYGKRNVEIDTTLLPDYLYNGLLNQEKRNEIIDLLYPENSEYYEFKPKGNEEFNFTDEYDISEGLYKEICSKYYYYSEKGYSHKRINEKINGHIERYVKKLQKKFNVGKEIPENQELFKIVSPRVYNAVETAITVAEGKLKKKFSKKVRVALAMHVSALMERIAENKIIVNSEINKIALNNPNEFNVARIVKNILEDELDISIPKEEIGFIAMLLYAVDEENIRENKKIGVVVLAHGKHTASSIADVVNSLLDTDHCKAIDMPLDERVETILDRTTELVKQVNQGKGVLLLVDMGSLIAFAEIITKKTNINVRSVEMVSTPIAIEVVRKCLLPEASLEQLVKDIQRITPHIGRLVTKNVKMKASISQSRIIITTCITGKGTAIKLAKLLKSSIPILDEYNIILKPMSMNEATIHNLNDIENILVVVGSTNPNLTNIPYIPIDEVIVGDGLRKISLMIQGEEKNKNMYDLNEPNFVVKMLNETLIFLNPIKVYNVVNHSFEIITKSIAITDYRSTKLSFVIHTCSMIERLIINERLTYNNIEDTIRNNPVLYNAIKSSIGEVEQTFNIEIPDTEIGYIIDLFNTQ
ncbi:sigma 54-interacting transcriptional regulator [Irregularibacter muris]|uniref:Sigma 54-interacting transcriptional regulator n=1 Tax=Irregularibacter muris TaxID=1796619 RepID=A0AAE3HI82_9FIRM|nr:sigma 54-interacting transcriptional regulator [Irregularibacter muris]MCR1900007.1 sigma 54-interacting transcriptional regulator [Irregularibacter muris]